MSESVPHLAKRLGLTSQAIQQRMRNIDGFVYNYTSKPHRSRVISDKGVQILINHNSMKSKGHARRSRKLEKSAYINQLRNDIKYARQDSSHKTKQIDALNEQIKRMTLTTNNLYERYNQSQRNLNNEQAKLQHERDNEKLLKYKETAEHNNLLEYKKGHKGVSKHGWIYRLFH